MNKYILNMTQHDATSEQKEQCVIEPHNKERIRKLLTFDDIPVTGEMYSRALDLAIIAENEVDKFIDFVDSEAVVTQVMIGGAPFFMPVFEQALKDRGYFRPVYAFSKRISEDQLQPDGTVHKASVFKHIGFVEGEGYE